MTVEIWTAPITSTASETINVKDVNLAWSGHIGIYETNSMDPTTFVTGTGQCVSGCNGNLATASTSFAYSSYFAIAGAVDDNAGSWTAGSGFALNTATGRSATDQYSTTVSSPTQFPLTFSSGVGHWVLAGIVFNQTTAQNYTRSPAATVALSAAITKSETLKASPSAIALSASIVKSSSVLADASESVSASLTKSVSLGISASESLSASIALFKGYFISITASLVLNPNVLPIVTKPAITTTVTNTTTSNVGNIVGMVDYSWLMLSPFVLLAVVVVIKKLGRR